VSPAAVAARMVRAEDVEELALAGVDQEFVDMYGPDQRVWKQWQVDTYLAALDQVHAEFAPQAVAA
jgi:hypothetical protein